MFRKTARVAPLGWAETKGGLLLRTAQLDEPAAVGDALARSYYLDGSRNIDIGGILERVASIYAISPNPDDYLFEAIRANTVAIPNENHDAFPKKELLAFNTKLARQVYMTYVEKPHHMNHRTENPREARGVILDAHYAEETPPLETCPRCASKTAAVEQRTPDGIFCRRCGMAVKDESVEVLVAVDTKKDPALAHGIRAGILNASSMGCNCVSTACNVCRHVAYSAAEFCDHIRPGNKGTLWMKLADKFRRVEKRALEQEFKKRGFKFDLADFVSAHHEDGFIVLKAHEDCQDLVFDELSRVHQPADPKALQIELFNLRARYAKTASADDVDLAALRRETELLIKEALMVKQPKAASRRAQTEPTPEVVPPKSETPVNPNGTGPGGPGVQNGDVVGEDAAGNVKMQFEVPQGYGVFLQPPGGAAPVPVSQGGAPPSGSPMPEEQPSQGPEGPMTNQELGIEDEDQMNNQSLPPAASKTSARVSVPLEGPFASAYDGFKVRVSKLGTATVESPAGPVLLIRPPRKIASKDGLAQFGREVFLSLLQHGLVRTAKKYRAAFSPRFADITDAAMNDMDGFARVPRDSATEDGAMHDMRDVKRSPVDDSLAGYSSHVDMKNVKRRDVPSTLRDGTVDHELGRHSEPGSLTAVPEDASDRREQHEEFSMGKSDSTAGGTRDLKLKDKGANGDWGGSRRKGGKPGRAAAPASAPTAEVLDARYRKLYAAKLERERQQLDAQRKDFEATMLARMARALKIAAQRRSLNLEESPLKAAAFDVLASDREVGRDPHSGAPLVYSRMDGDLASFLIEAAWRDGLVPEIDSLVARAGELLRADPQYLADAERDLTRQAAAHRPPQIISQAQLAPVNEVQQHAEAMRHAAMNGNPVFAPAPEVDPVAMGAPVPEAGRFDRTQIRAALSGTKVNGIVNELRRPN